MSPECQASFDSLKAALTPAPVLAYADYCLPFVLYTDASNQGVGAVLAQVQEWGKRIIGYVIRGLHPAEQNDANYSSFKLELLALKWAVTEKFKDYLTGMPFTVYTDNNPVAHLQTARLGAVEQRWVTQLASFHYNIKYRTGKSNVNADTLSTFPVTIPEAAFSAAVELTPCGESEEWADGEWETAQANHPDIQAIKGYVERQVKPSGLERHVLSHRAQKMLQQWKRLRSKGNLLCRRVIDPHSNEEHFQIVCPSSRYQEVWRKTHKAATHAGVYRTLSRIRRKFYWPDQEGEVHHLQQGCIVCSLQREKVESRAPLNTITVSYPLYRR